MSNNGKKRRYTEKRYNFYARRPANYDYFDIDVYHCLTVVAIVIAIVALLISLVALSAKAATKLSQNDSYVTVTETPVDPVCDRYIEISDEPTWEMAFTAMPYHEDDEIEYGDEVINVNGSMLTKYDLPSERYNNMDFQSMLTFMNFRKAVTNKNSSAYEVCWSDLAYTDDHGFRRYKTTSDQFTVNGQDDYVVALGNYYKTKGVCGERFLIVTTSGAYTAITGDEKDDRDTDQYKMGHIEAGKMSMIEFVVDDWSLLDDMMRKMGSAKYSSIDAFQGDILYIYKITQNESI